MISLLINWVNWEHVTRILVGSLQEHCVVFNKDRFLQMWLLGLTHLQFGANIYLVGVMFTSQNRDTWWAQFHFSDNFFSCDAENKQQRWKFPPSGTSEDHGSPFPAPSWPNYLQIIAQNDDWTDMFKNNITSSAVFTRQDNF